MKKGAKIWLAALAQDRLVSLAALMAGTTTRSHCMDSP
jgi:hypothetical protein